MVSMATEILVYMNYHKSHWEKPYVVLSRREYMNSWKGEKGRVDV